MKLDRAGIQSLPNRAAKNLLDNFNLLGWIKASDRIEVVMVDYRPVRGNCLRSAFDYHKRGERVSRVTAVHMVAQHNRSRTEYMINNGHVPGNGHTLLIVFHVPKQGEKQ